MARIRTVKPEFWTDGGLIKISRDSRLFYIGLWNFADDNGVLEYDPLTIKARIFPCDDVSIPEMTSELINAQKVIAYKDEEKIYVCCKNMINHQKIDRPRKSYLPLPPKDKANHLKSSEISPVCKEGIMEVSKVRDIKDPPSATNFKMVDLKDVNLPLSEPAKHKIYNEVLLQSFEIRGWRRDPDFCKPIFARIAERAKLMQPKDIFPYFKEALKRDINENADWYSKTCKKEEVSDIAQETAKLMRTA